MFERPTMSQKKKSVYRLGNREREREGASEKDRGRETESIVHVRSLCVSVSMCVHMDCLQRIYKLLNILF